MAALRKKLVVHAFRCLYKASAREGRPRAPQNGDVEDAVQNAMLSCASGDRVWPLGVPFEAFMHGVVKSCADHVYDAARRRRAADIDAVPAPAAPALPADERIDHRRRLAKAEEAARGSDDTKALFYVISSGNHDDKRADYAEALEVPPERISNIREKMDRQFKKAGLLEEENHDHDDQAPRRRSR